MSEDKPLIDQLLAAANGDIAVVDASNPVDVERFLSDIVMSVDHLGDDEFAALTEEAQNWLNAVALAMNEKRNLADAAFTEGGMQLSDLPTTADAPAPVSQQTEDGGGDAPKAETPPNAPVSRAKAADKPKAVDAKARLAFSRANPWGRDTKSRAAVDALFTTKGGAARDIEALSSETGMIETGLKQTVVHALQAFDCLRKCGWIAESNSDVQSFIQSIEEVES